MSKLSVHPHTSRALPEDYVFKKVILKGALLMWYTADTVARRGTDRKVIPPLRVVERKDFKTASNKNKFSRMLKPLTKHLETLLQKDQPALIKPTIWNQQVNRSLTPEQFEAIWKHTKTYFSVTTVKGYKRSRPTDISMSYAAKLLRQRVQALAEDNHS